MAATRCQITGFPEASCGDFAAEIGRQSGSQKLPRNFGILNQRALKVFRNQRVMIPAASCQAGSPPLRA